MKDQDKTKAQLISELEELRGRVSALEASETEWRRTEEALQGSEEQFRLLVEAIPQPIWRSDADGNVIEFNRRWHEYTGQTAEEAKGSGWAKAVHSDEAAMVVQKVRAGITSGAAIEIVNRLRRASDGSYRWHLARAVPMTDRGGKIIGWFGCATDIDDQKRAEEALRESEERFRTVFEEGPLGVALVGLDARIQHVNRRFCEMLGYSEDEILALGIRGITHQDDWEKDHHYGSRLRRGEIPLYTIEKRYVRKDGQVIWGQLTASMMYDAQGKPTTIIGMVEDITERKQAEAKLRDSERTLRTLIDASPESILLADHTATILLVNKTAADRLGKPEDYIVGRKPHDVVPPEVADRRMRHFEEVVRTGKPVRFDDVRSGRHIENVMQPIFDDQGKVAKVALLGIDQTDRKRAEEALQRQTRELATINRLGQLVNTDLSLDRFGEAVVQGIFDAINPDVVMLFRRDGDGLPLHCFGPTDSIVCRTPLPTHRAGECLCGLAVTERRAIYSPDIGRDPRCTWEECKKAGLRSFAALPLRSGDEIIGVLGLGAATDRNFHEESSFLETLANDIALCFHNSLLYEQVRDQAQQLEQKVKERTAELSVANEQLRIFQQFAEASGQGFSMADLGGNLLYMNPALCRMLGENRSHDRIGQHVSIYYPDEVNRSRETERFPALMRDGYWQGELPMLSLQGKLIPTWHNTFLIRDESGKPIRIGVAITDISERKRAEAALRANHDELRAIYDGMSDGLLIADVETKQFVRCNTAMCRMLGYSEDELLSRSILEIHPTEQVPRVLEEFRVLIENAKAVATDVPVLRKNGSVFYADVSHHEITYNGRYCSVGIFRDITDRKEAHEAIQASEAKYKTLVDTSPDTVVLADLEGRFTFVSHGILELHGSESLDEFIGKHPLDFIVPEDHQRFLTNLKRTLDEGVTREVEYTFVRKDGSRFPGEVSATAVRDAKGRPTALMAVVRDITERKQAQEALRQSEERFALAIRAAQEGVWDWNLENDEVFYSRRWKEMLGYSESEIEPHVSAWKRLLHPDDLPMAQQVVESVCSGRQDYEMEFRLRHKDGHYVHVLSRGCPVRREPDGPFTRIVGTHFDLTERKRALETLQQNERALQEAQRLAQVGSWELDTETGTVTWTEELHRITGRDPNSPAPNYRTHPELFTPESWQRLEVAVRELSESGTVYELDLEVVRPDQTRRWVIARGERRYDTNGHVVGLRGTVQDITERKQAQEALRASEERYGLVVRGAGVGIWDYDICAGRLYFSPRWKALFGYAENDIGESLEDWIRLLHPEERDWTVKFLEDFLAGTEPTVTVEYRLRHGDGSYRWIVAHAVVVRDEQGKAIRLVGSHGDITERKRAEEAVQREHRTLEHMLKASDHERQLIAYDIHDGLAQYLTGAIMQYQMSEHLRGQNAQEAGKAFDAGMAMLRQSHAEARRLISGVRPPILDESGIMAAISHLIHDPAFDQGPKIDFRSRVTFSRLNPVVENVIYRIVQEGLSNARNHSKSKKIVVSLVQRGERLRIEIRDWGVGFDPKTVQENRFGLDGIRERARLLGGKCNIKSKPGEGTTVVVELSVTEHRQEE